MAFRPIRVKLHFSQFNIGSERQRRYSVTPKIVFEFLFTRQRIGQLSVSTPQYSCTLAEKLGFQTGLIQHHHEQIAQRSAFSLSDISAVLEASARQKSCQITSMMGVGVFEVAAEQNRTELYGRFIKPDRRASELRRPSLESTLLREFVQLD